MFLLRYLFPHQKQETKNKSTSPIPSTLNIQSFHLCFYGHHVSVVPTHQNIPYIILIWFFSGPICLALTLQIHILQIPMKNIYRFYRICSSTLWTGLEKLGFLVHKSPCSSKQVQENVVHLVILCTLWLYEVHVFTSSCTSPCTKWNMLWKDEAMQ